MSYLNRGLGDRPHLVKKLRIAATGHRSQFVLLRHTVMSVLDTFMRSITIDREELETCDMERWTAGL